MRDILRKLEKGLEKVIEAPFAKVFKSGVHPLEVGKRILSALEDGRVVGINQEVVVPNRYKCLLSPEDYERLTYYLNAMAGELEAMIIDYCREREYLLPARPAVSFSVSGELEEGEFEIEASLSGGGGTPHHDTRGAVLEEAGREGGEGRIPVTGYLVIEDGPGRGNSFRLETQETTLGRLPGNDIVIGDPKVSRHHAVVVKGPEGFVIRDLGSTNGTFVNGRRVSERLLAPGDLIVLGDTRLRFQLEEDT